MQHHFWVRSRVELNFEALACHLRTTEERIRAPTLGTFSFLFFFRFFLLCFFYPFKTSFRTKQHTLLLAQTAIHQKTPS